MRDGTTNADIASYLANEGLITQREKTFAGYLNAYKRRNFEFVANGKTLGQAINDRDFDGIVSGNAPALDVEKELEKVAKFQKRRLAIGHIIEESTGFVNATLHRDIKEMRETLDALDKVRGGTRGSGRKGQQLEVTAEAGEALRNVQKAEDTQDKISNMVTQLKKGLEIKAEQDADVD